MRNPLLVFIGLVAVLIVAASTAQSYFRQPPAPPPAAPHYVNRQPFTSNPNPPADPDRAPAATAARAAHRGTLTGGFAAFDHPWPAMCSPEQGATLTAALRTYY